MSIRDDLIAAKALIDTPKKWIKGSWHRNGCYCALGAAYHVTKSIREADSIDTALRDALPAWASSVTYYNDKLETEHSDVLALFDRAIAAQPVSP